MESQGLPEPAVYNVDEAAAKLGVSRNTYYALAARGELPAIRIGRLLKVPKAALDRLLEPAK